jgi:hypothetical protein
MLIEHKISQEEHDTLIETKRAKNRESYRKRKVKHYEIKNNLHDPDKAMREKVSIRTEINITIHHVLQEFSKEIDVPMSVIIERALIEYISRYRPDEANSGGVFYCPLPHEDQKPDMIPLYGGVVNLPPR